MYHSFAEGKKLQCLKCDQLVRFDSWQIVDINERPDLLEKIHACTLHDAYCPYCNNLIVKLDSPLLIYRPDENPMFIYSSAEETVVTQDQEMFFQLLEKLKTSVGESLPSDFKEKILAPMPRSILSVFLREGPAAARLAQIELDKHNQATAELVVDALLPYAEARSLAEMKTALQANFEILTSFRCVGYLNEIIFKEQSEPAKFLLIQKRDLLIHFREIGLESTIKELGEAGTIFNREVTAHKKGREVNQNQVIKKRNISSFFWDLLLKPVFWFKNRPHNEKNDKMTGHNKFQQVTSEIIQSESGQNPGDRKPETKQYVKHTERPQVDQVVESNIMTFLREHNASLPDSNKMPEDSLKKFMYRLIGDYESAQDNPEIPKIVILITNFQGFETENQEFTKSLLFEFRFSLVAYDNVRIISMPQEISDNQGKNYARRLGEESGGDIVLWGKKGDSGGISINIEILTNHHLTYIDSEIAKVLEKEIANLKSISLVQRDVSDLQDLVSFLSGLVLFQDAIYDEAIALFDKSLASKKWFNENKIRSVILFYRGQSKIIMKQFDEAIEDYSEAINLDPSHARFFTNRGSAYQAKNQFDKAFNDFSTAISIDISDSLAYYNRGQIFSDRGMHENAISDFTKALEQDPKYLLVYISRGREFGNINQEDNAILDFSKAIEIDPKNSQIYSNRGFAYYRKKDYGKSILDFSTAIELNPEDEDALSKRGEAYRHVGDNDKSIIDLSKAIDLDSSHSDTYLARALSYTKKGEFTLAFDDFNQSILINPNSADAFAMRGNLYAIKGDKQKAKTDILRAIELDPKYKELKKNWDDIFEE